MSRWCKYAVKMLKTSTGRAIRDIAGGQSNKDDFLSSMATDQAQIND